MVPTAIESVSALDASVGLGFVVEDVGVESREENNSMGGPGASLLWLVNGDALILNRHYNFGYFG